MKTAKAHIAIVVFLIGTLFSSANPIEDPNSLIDQMRAEIALISAHYNEMLDNRNSDLAAINTELQVAKSTDEIVALLLKKDQIQDAISLLKRTSSNDISKVRYLKGLQIIKILYEKILSLDHHFASVRTFSEINKISNPNQYPEYAKLKDLLASKREKKSAVDLTSILGTNTVVSVIQTFTTMISSSLSKEEKEKELSNVECIFDFTLRMQNDLNTIYFETAFLQTSNDKMRTDIEQLFRDYTKVIAYESTLEQCRTNDDWETLTKKMEEYITQMSATTGTKQYKMQVNLEFPIDRLLQFIIQYNNFIDQGGKFYEKFKIILSSYENEKQCETKLPPEYSKLKSDIDVAINKFNVAYKPVEVNGSKMKEILYGLNEFE